MNKDLAVKKAELGGMDSEKRLKEQEAEVNAQKGRLEEILKEIEKLRDLAGEFDGYTSSAEEESFIESLINELGEAKKKVGEAMKECDGIIEEIA